MAGRQRKVQVVVLCGGFGETILGELQTEIATISDTHRKNAYRNLIRTGPSGPFVTEALLPVHRASAVYHMLSSMDTVQRLVPLEESVFFVHNEANRDQFFGSHYEGKGFVETAWAWGEVKLSKHNFVSNGAVAAEQWRGEAADLQVMLNSGLLHPEADLLVVRGAMSFVADYAFSRIVEHPLVRNCSCLAYVQVDGPRAQIMHFQPNPPVLLDVENPSGSCSPLRSIQRGMPRMGDCGAMGLAFISARDVAAVADMPPASTIEEVALSLLENGVPMCGLNLQWGSFSVATVQELLYTESVFDALSHDIRSTKSKKDNKDRVSSVQLGEEITLLGTPGDTLQGHMRSHTPESHLQDFAKGADHTYFRDVTKSSGIQPEGSLPDTFYVSQYRRDAMNTQRFLTLNRSWDARNKETIQKISGKRL